MRYPSHKVRIQTQGTMSTAYNQLALLMAPYSEKTSPQMLAVLDNCLTQPPNTQNIPQLNIFFTQLRRPEGSNTESIRYIPLHRSFLTLNKNLLNPIALYNPPTNLRKLCIIPTIPLMCKRGIYTLLLSLTRRRWLNPSGVHGSAIMIKLTHLRLNKLATGLQHHTRPSNPLQMRKHLARINRRTHLRDHPFYTANTFIFISRINKNHAI